ncbi:CDP-glycerol glycerophosphotransferase family protein [Streptomyces sp. NPDC001046]|uniref:CDP-glycerol glycerophosphotransferase family protein n=1 Tax=Streptomyces sp. NPDC001046 TaxID=3364543 RepID=UPI00368C47F9
MKKTINDGIITANDGIITANEEDIQPLIINNVAYLRNDTLSKALEIAGMANVNRMISSYLDIKTEKIQLTNSLIRIKSNIFFVKNMKQSIDTVNIELVGFDSDNKKTHFCYPLIQENQLDLKVNLNILKNNKPLSEGTYNLYWKVTIKTSQIDTKIIGYLPIRDVYTFLNSSIHTTNLYFYTGKLQLEYNTIIKYGQEKDTIQVKNKLLKKINPSKQYGDIKNKTEKHSYFYLLTMNKLWPFFFYIVSWIFPVKKNRILFLSDSRSEIGGNYSFILNELQKRNQRNKRRKNYEIRYIFKENNFTKKSFRDMVKLVYFLSSSKYVFLEENYPFLTRIKTKNKTKIIQLWHAAGAFKKFGYSRLGLPGGPTTKSKDHRYYDFASVTSDSLVPIYSESFDIEIDNVLPLGLPRSDLFYDTILIKETKERVFEEYPFLKGKKIILFAPTFRGGTRKSAHYPYEQLNFEDLYSKLSDEYILILKVHFNTLNKIHIPFKYKDFIFDMSDYRDINDLFLVSDLLITDYSSVCFEFSLLNKPMLFFAFDEEKYVLDRGFYFKYDEIVPGKITRDCDELITAILNEDFEIEKIKPFRDYYFKYQDGKSSKRVLDTVLE